MNTSITQANKSPLNTSKSKAMFSFPRGERFPHLSESGRYMNDDQVSSTISPPCSANAPLPLDTATRWTSPCTFHLTQQQASPFSRQVHSLLWLPKESKARLYDCPGESRLQICLNLQPDPQSRPRRIQSTREGEREEPHDGQQAQLPLHLGIEHRSWSRRMYFPSHIDQI